jgi:hypothetical protein
LRKPWSATWPRKGENPKPEGVKPPPTPPPPTDSQRYDPNVGQPPPVPPLTVGSAVPIVVIWERDEWPFETLTFTLETLVEDRIREIVREEIRKVEEANAHGSDI